MDDHAVIKTLILEYLYVFVCYHLKIHYYYYYYFNVRFISYRNILDH